MNLSKLRKIAEEATDGADFRVMSEPYFNNRKVARFEVEYPENPTSADMQFYQNFSKQRVMAMLDVVEAAKETAEWMVLDNCCKDHPLVKLKNKLFKMGEQDAE